MSLSYSAETVKVYSPDLNDKYNAVVRNVVDGIESELGEVEHIAFKTPPSLPAESVIILTSKAIRELDTLNHLVPSHNILGLAELSGSERAYGVSMFIEPSNFIVEINRLNPKIKNIVFFNDARRNARQSVDILKKMYGVSVKSIDVRNVGEAIDNFKEQNAIANHETAFVFTRGFIELSEDILLEIIAKDTWDSGVMSVASKPKYVKNGFLLALAPDYRGYGAQIGALYKKARDSNYIEPETYYLKAYLRAINLRTAKNIEIHLGVRDLKHYELSYSGN